LNSFGCRAVQDAADKQSCVLVSQATPKYKKNRIPRLLVRDLECHPATQELTGSGQFAGRQMSTRNEVPVRILVADDHAVVRTGLRAILRQKDDWEICAEAGTGFEAVVLAKQFCPEVAVIDSNMPGQSGIEAAAEIKKSVPGVEIVVLTLYYSKGLLEAATKAGALGFVLKSDAERDLIAAVEAVRYQRPFVSPIAATAPSASVASPRRRGHP
jgi:CheY-like chemotaxis protein